MAQGLGQVRRSHTARRPGRDPRGVGTAGGGRDHARAVGAELGGVTLSRDHARAVGASG